MEKSRSVDWFFFHKSVKIEAAWSSDNRALAGKLEYHIKRLTKAEKEKLISENCIEKVLFNKIEVEKYSRLKYNGRM